MFIVLTIFLTRFILLTHKYAYNTKELAPCGFGSEFQNSAKFKNPFLQNARTATPNRTLMPCMKRRRIRSDSALVGLEANFKNRPDQNLYPPAICKMTCGIMVLYLIRDACIVCDKVFKSPFVEHV